MVAGTLKILFSLGLKHSKKILKYVSLLDRYFRAKKTQTNCSPNSGHKEEGGGQDKQRSDLPPFLAAPGEARGCSINSLVIY